MHHKLYMSREWHESNAQVASLFLPERSTCSDRGTQPIPHERRCETNTVVKPRTTSPIMLCEMLCEILYVRCCVRFYMWDAVWDFICEILCESLCEILCEVLCSMFCTFGTMFNVYMWYRFSWTLCPVLVTCSGGSPRGCDAVTWSNYLCFEPCFEPPSHPLQGDGKCLSRGRKRLRIMVKIGRTL